jgi:hypothetical protein
MELILIFTSKPVLEMDLLSRPFLLSRELMLMVLLLLSNLDTITGIALLQLSRMGSRGGSLLLLSHKFIEKLKLLIRILIKKRFL